MLSCFIFGVLYYKMAIANKYRLTILKACYLRYLFDCKFGGKYNMDQLIPKELLEKSNKILFIGSIAIGDFTYLQACFRSLAQQYPNLKMDLWLDEYKGKSPVLRWGHKKHDIVYDWIESSPLFNKVFKNVGGWWNLPAFFEQLRQENYPIIVCLFNRRN